MKLFSLFSPSQKFLDKTIDYFPYEGHFKQYLENLGTTSGNVRPTQQAVHCKDPRIPFFFCSEELESSSPNSMVTGPLEQLGISVVLGCMST